MFSCACPSAESSEVNANFRAINFVLIRAEFCGRPIVLKPAL
jgi:hypothetical protein